MSKRNVPKQDYISFTKEMKKDYKILVPMMLQMHFKILCGVLRNFGYDVELLETAGPHIAEEGLRHVHNPAFGRAVRGMHRKAEIFRSRSISCKSSARRRLPRIQLCIPPAQSPQKGRLSAGAGRRTQLCGT